MNNKNYKIKTSLLVLLVFLIGLSLRLHKLGFQSFWLDEYCKIRAALDPKLFLSPFEFLPPVYLLLLKLWLKFFTVNEINVRLLGALIGAFSIPVFYLLGKELFNKRIALWASFFLAISAIHVDYCQEAKHYSLTLMATMLMQFTYMRIIKNLSPRSFLWYGLCAVVGLYTHYFLVLLLCAQAVHLWIYSGKDRQLFWKILIVQAISLAILLPYILPHFAHPGEVTGSFGWIVKPSLDSPVDTIFAMLTGKQWPQIPIAFLNLLYLRWGHFVFAVLGVILLLHLLKRNPEEKLPLSLVMAWLIFPILILYLFSVVVFPLYHFRYLLISMPALYLLLAYLVAKERLVIHAGDRGKERERLVFAGTLGVILIIAWSLYIAFGYGLVERIYDGTSLPFLNRIIAGQNDWSLASYLGKTDRIFCGYLGLGLLFIILMAPRNLRGAACRLVIIFLFIAVNLSSLKYYFNCPVRAQFREAAEFISKNCAKDEKILVRGFAREGELFLYYFKKSGFGNPISTNRDRMTPIPAGYSWIVDAAGITNQNDRLSHVKMLYGITIYRSKEMTGMPQSQKP